MNIPERLDALRALMKKNKIDAYLIPSDDDHASEYVNDHFKCREWISGFTGSAGTVIVTADDAWLWTDGRYFLQAEEQLRGTGIGLMKMNEPGVPTIKEKLCELASGKNGYIVGFDGSTMTAAEGEKLENDCPITIFYSKDLVGEIWADRPELKPSEIWELPQASCGKSYEDKLDEVLFEMSMKGVDVLLISDLMETAWLFNLRGGDIQNTPVFYSYAILTLDKCFLFTLPGAVSDNLKAILEARGITLKNYDEVTDILISLTLNSETVWADKSKTSYALINDTKSKILDEPTPIEIKKAVKNETEIAATEHAHLKDGVAVTKFIYWLKQEMAAGQHLTELSACDKLESLRRAQDGCFDLSFPTIAGYMSNGAIIHYEPTPESDTKILPDGVLLVDSGGQYLDGTTDITRTIAVGPLTDKIKRCYTLVLKGHIDLAMAKFPRGTTGKELDELTRKPLLDQGLDYNHGTGHGVGHVLSVHEGPNYISKRDGSHEMIPGMITSDEPGVYLEGEFGIRIESEILCTKLHLGTGEKMQNSIICDADNSDSDQMTGQLGFKVITLAPLERDAIIPEMLTEKELSWLNSYHERVYSSISPFLNAGEAEWLRKVTMPL